MTIYTFKSSVLVGLLTAVGLIQGISFADQDLIGSPPGAGLTSFNPTLLPLYASSDPTSAPAAAAPTEGPYGLFNLLDSRSQFGTGFFPEPFLVDEGDRDREVAFSWYHQEGPGTGVDQVTGEIEWTFWGTTIEIEAPWETD